MSRIEDYCVKYSKVESNLLSSLKKFTYENEEAPQMISGSLVGNLLMMLIKTSNFKKVLEVGMFTGYSALNMAECLPDDGEVHTCEIMDQHIHTANSFFKRSQHANKIFIYKGDACETLEKFKINSFDLIFIDADKTNYITYYKQCMHLLKSGGVMILDNMLWGGSVLNPKDEQSITLNKLAGIIHEDKRNINTMIPIRDGLMVCYKI